MEIIPITKIKVRLESSCRTYEGIKALLESENLFEIIPRDREEEILFSLCRNNYYWDTEYVYDDTVKTCKINFVADQIIFNHNYNPDEKIKEICNGFEFYWKGKKI